MEHKGQSIPTWQAVIDAKGRLLPQGKRARRHLASRSGTWTVVPTPDELLVLRRVEPADETNQTDSAIGKVGSVALSGVIQGSADVIDLINFIFNNQKTGVLVILAEDIKKSLYFRRGDVRMAASNQKEDRLGAVLYRYGTISQAQLETALSEATERKLGQVLVDQGVLTVHQLYQAIRRQIEDIFYSTLLLRNGVFYFYTLKDDSAFPGSLNLSTHNLLMEGVRRIDEMSFFREKLPSPDTIVQVSPDVPPRNLSEREHRIYSLVDGHRTIGQIARASHLGEFETTKILYHLLQLRHVRLREAADAVRGLKPSSSGQALAAVVDTFNEVYRKIFAEISASGKLDQLQAGLTSFFHGETSFGELFAGIEPAEDGTIPPQAILDNLRRLDVHNRSDYLYQALNELLFLLMFTAGQTLSEEDERDLHARLNTIFSKVEQEG